MKKIFIILAILAFIFPSSAEAQVAGYMGKKFAIKYKSGLSFGSRDPHFKLFYAHSPEIEYVVGNHRSIVADFRYTKSTPTDYKSDHHLSAFPGGKYEIKNIAFSFYVRNYSKERSAPAPLGNYWGYGIGFGFNQMQFIDWTSVYFMDQINTFSVYFGFDYGRQYVLFNHLLLDMNLRIGIPLTGYRSLIYDGLDRSIGGKPHLDIFLLNIVQFKLGFGALLF